MKQFEVLWHGGQSKEQISLLRAGDYKKRVYMNGHQQVTRLPSDLGGANHFLHSHTVPHTSLTLYALYLTVHTHTVRCILLFTLTLYALYLTAHTHTVRAVPCSSLPLYTQYLTLHL